MRDRHVLQLIGVFFCTLLPGMVSAETIAQTTATATNLGLYGGEVRDAASDPDSDYVYVTTYSPNGFFASADNGVTWRGLDASVYDLGEPRGVELDEDGNVYILMGDGVMKSTDHGTTLEVAGDVGAFGATMLYHNGALIVGRTDGAVSVSTDQGATFTTTAPLQASSIVLSVAASETAGTYYAVLSDNTVSTLYVSTDGGANWSVMNTDTVTGVFYSISVNPQNLDHLLLLTSGSTVTPWQSVDGGSTWEELTEITVPGSLAFDSTGRIYIGANYTDDNGETWGYINTTTPANRVSNIWVDSANDNRLYGSTFGAVAISDDRGETWIDSNEGITAVTVHDVAQSTDKNTVWIATGAGLAKTTNYLDASPTWAFPINYDYYPSAVWVSPVDSNIVVVGGYTNIYRTIDGGTTWETIEGWDSTYAVQDLVSDPNNPALLYISGAIQNTFDTPTGIVMQSTDSGATWTDIAVVDAISNQALAVSADGTLYVGAGAMGTREETATGIYTYDGTTWLHLENSPDEQITSLVADPDDANILYATASDFDSAQHEDGGLFKTVDAGATWMALEDAPGLESAGKYRVITIQNSTDTLYMAGTDVLTGAGIIWKSTDGGDTWGTYYTGLQNETFNTLLFDGLIAGNSRGAYDIRGTVKFKITKNTTKITAVLKDRATNETLVNKKVTLWKKKNGEWVKIKTDRTNSRGKAVFTIHPKRTRQYQIRYTPIDGDEEEYTKKRSKIFKIHI